MSNRHRIADFLTDEQRRRILAAEYVPIPGSVQCLTADGCCPLEVAFGLAPSRTVSTVLSAIWDLGIAARVAARDFMHNVDFGAITPEDLPAAIGAPAPTSPPAERQEG